VQHVPHAAQLAPLVLDQVLLQVVPEARLLIVRLGPLDGLQLLFAVGLGGLLLLKVRLALDQQVVGK